MRVRALDESHDWLFGKGQNDYKTAVDALRQNIDTRLLQFLGDCFFDQTAGVDWFNLMGQKSQVAITLSVSSVILNTPGVTSINQIEAVLSETREFTVEYIANSIFGPVNGQFILDESNLPGG